MSEIDTAIPTISPKILAQLTSRHEAKRREANEILDQLGDKKFEALLAAISKERACHRKQQRVLKGVMIGFGALMVLLVLAGVAKSLYTGKWDFFDNWGSFFTMFAVTGSSVGITQSQKNAVRLLAQFDDIRAIPPLLEVRESEDKNIRDLAEQSLINLLPKLKASDANLLDEVQMFCLGRALKSKNTEFVCMVLKAMEQVGDEKHLDAVQRLAGKETSDPHQMRIRVAAQECEPYLRRRVEEKELANTLLRASQPESAPNMLLRPVEYRPDTATHELLRPEMAPELQRVTSTLSTTKQAEQEVQQIGS